VALDASVRWHDVIYDPSLLKHRINGHNQGEPMTLEALRESLPDYAKDLKLNLSTLLSETTLNDEQKGSTSSTRQANPTLK
jgi:hypothetical protein